MAMRGFLPLAVSLTESTASPFAHHLFFKKQNAKPKPAVSWDGEEEEDLSERTIFVTNIPQSFDHSDVMDLFGCFGEVDAVLFQSEHASQEKLPPGVMTSNKPKLNGCQRADVVFSTKEGLSSAMQASHASLKNTRQPCVEGSKPQGVAKWVSEWKAVRPSSATLQLQVDRFMEAFDQRMAQEKASREGPLVDAEGWTVVRYASKRRKLLLPKGLEEKKKKERKSDKPLPNFYKHQQMQKKREQLAELRRKFEQDKSRLAAQTATRKFQPF